MPSTPRQLGLVRRLLLVSVILGIVATACGSPATTTEAAAPSDTTAVSALTGEFPILNTGESIDLATLQGQDVVLWFWAPW